MDCEKKLYAIREVSEITGIKPVTLRAWQRRYNLVQPERTDKGHRLYTDEHIALIGNIQRWLNKGVPIGKVKKLLEENGELGEPIESDQQQLDELELLLNALSALNKGKAESIVSTVLKEYPLEIVDKQFIQPAYSALNVVRYALRVLQVGLLDSILVSRLNSIIESENKAARSGKCLVVSCDSSSNVSSRMWALRLSEEGRHIVIVDGIDDFSGLIEHAGLLAFQTLGVFSSRPLNASQKGALEKVKQSFQGEFLTSEFVSVG